MQSHEDTSSTPALTPPIPAPLSHQGRLIPYPYSARDKGSASLFPPTPQAERLLNALLTKWRELKTEGSKAPFIGILFFTSASQTQHILETYCRGESQTWVSASHQTALLQAMETLLHNDDRYPTSRDYIRFIPISVMTTTTDGNIQSPSDREVGDCLRNLLCVLGAGCSVFALQDTNTQRFLMREHGGLSTARQNQRIQTLLEHLSQCESELTLPREELHGKKFALDQWLEIGHKNQDPWGFPRVQRWLTALEVEHLRLRNSGPPFFRSGIEKAARIENLQKQLNREIIQKKGYHDVLTCLQNWKVDRPDPETLDTGVKAASAESNYTSLTRTRSIFQGHDVRNENTHSARVLIALEEDLKKHAP